MVRTLLTVLLFAGLAQAAPVSAATCDRACLGRSLDRYLAAMVAHKPAMGNLAPNIVMTENGVATRPDKGLWQNATALGGLQRRYFDAQAGQAAYYGLIDEGGTPAVAMIRIRVVGKRVTESEAMVGRSTERLYDPQGMIAVAPDQNGMSGGRPMSRAQLLAAANGYFDAMQSHSGANVVRTDDCVRLENGHKAGANCVDAFERLTQISAVGHRRMPLVDEQAGAVIGTAMFLRPAGAMMPNGQPWKRNLFMNLFIFKDGRITMSSGAMHYLEAGDPDSTGWADQAAN